MNTPNAMSQGAAAIATAVREIDPAADLASATPCTDFDLRALVNHSLGTTAALTRLGRREPLDPDDPWGSRTDDAGEGWTARLAGQLEATAGAWSDPAAWKGELDLGGGNQPASIVGEMAFVEVMMHGWDITRAGERRPEIGDEIGAALLRAVSTSAEIGRQLGAYGPEIEIDPDASDFEKALGVSGRDPSWSPAR